MIINYDCKTFIVRAIGLLNIGVGCQWWFCLWWKVIGLIISRLMYIKGKVTMIDFGDKQNEMIWNFIKTKSLGLRKTSLNTVNFCSSTRQSLHNFHTFFMAWTKINKIQPIFDNFSLSFKKIFTFSLLDFSII